ncbi:hypothetical protein TBLA_0F02420 [Henningerozyma blattae CBS 6284]|uniref:CBS domain-containing protein n=1 Tax=Henningerozyma blattae (strain ATCC 34711 / CBS 6284 / DSM 70876 / NBRC 10599 / NRRL Y-10934 / UCD 77-7) TaxID=1071380 RepID=I2H5Y0_HENB6|nr:hypothetical protein TBLA_0F02420 [Tetrapisispora blattae CBS 6284]CCH61782.1 hypothetical protein TBLA_0F02420 [Tetrapisispora blattae CBS 6284]
MSLSNSQPVVPIDWNTIKLQTLVQTNKLITVESSLSIEEAFNTLIKYNLTSLPVRLSHSPQTPIADQYLAFNYNDLNSYLLLALNKVSVADPTITADCQNGKPVKVGDFITVAENKLKFSTLDLNDSLDMAIDILGKGIHRLAILDTPNNTILGILSQRRLIKYIWDNARLFKNIQPILNKSLRELQIGNYNTQNFKIQQSRVISINGDEPLIKALFKMHHEKISSIAVVDNQFNLLGNISVTDVKHVTRTSQYPLLHKNCRHFISIILNSRGLENGKDSFPIFHVYPSSSLARTLAKLVATKSHRLWIVQQPSASIDSATSSTSSSTTTLDQDFTGLYEKEYRTGKLIGVVSLTDILFVLAKQNTNSATN